MTDEELLVMARHSRIKLQAIATEEIKNILGKPYEESYNNLVDLLITAYEIGAMDAGTVWSR